jgi:hypothetical protein
MGRGPEGKAKANAKANADANADAKADANANADADAKAGDGEGAADDPRGGAGQGRERFEQETDWLDPSARHAAHLAPPGGVAPLEVAAAPNAGEPVRARSLEELLPVLVRRIAWAGDRHKGTVRLELGAGAYAVTTGVVHADAGRVRVEIGGSEGPELDRLRARLDARLRGHGLDVDSVT